MPGSSAAWKNHERSVADFFLSERTYDHLTHRSRSKRDTPSDVLVDVNSWLTGIGELQAPEPWSKILVECKYRGKNTEEASWLRRYFQFMEKIPASVDTDLRRPLLLTQDGWYMCRLGHFYTVYRKLFDPDMLGVMELLPELAKTFWLQSESLKTPQYLIDWLDVAEDIDLQAERILPVICLGSSLRKHGPGGGKVIIGRLDGGIK